jgi:hypothetical protein
VLVVRTAPAQGAAGGGAETVAATDSAQGRSAASSKAMVTMHRPSTFAILARKDVAALFRVPQADVVPNEVVFLHREGAFIALLAAVLERIGSGGIFGGVKLSEVPRTVLPRNE